MGNLNDKVRAAAKAVAFRWPGVVEADDLEQEIWIRLLESPSYTTTLQAFTPDGQDRALKGIGHQLASQEREDYARFTGNFHYSTRDVRRMLADYASGAGDSINEPGTLTHSEQIDLTEGLAELADRYPEKYAVVVAQYFKGAPIHEHKMALQRAVDTLASIVNTNRRNAEADYEGPGSRPVLSNAVAAGRIRRQWDG